MKRRITRRELVAMAAVVPVAAQQPGTPPPIPSTPEEERKTVLAQFKSNAGLIGKVALPVTTEPAVHFKA